MTKAMLTGIVFLTVFAAGCVTNPATGQAQLNIITTPQEITIGENIDAQVRRQYTVITGTPQADRVKRIGARIAQASDRPGIQYHFTLLESDDVNAFAAPGGFIYVTTGLLAMVENDAELAGVIAHEVGHVAAFHSIRQMQQHLGYSILRNLVFDEDDAKAAGAADIAFNTIIMTGFSRRDEYQADKLGIKYAAAAGYDPYGLANFFVKLQQREREGILDKAFEIVMSHPITSQRRRRAEAYAAEYAAGER